MKIFGFDSSNSKGIWTLSHGFSLSPLNHAKKFLWLDTQIPNLCGVLLVHLDLYC